MDHNSSGPLCDISRILHYSELRLLVRLMRNTVCEIQIGGVPPLCRGGWGMSPGTTWVKVIHSVDLYASGRTVQSCRNRTSGHRSCFNNTDKVEKSALSMHAKDAHENDISLKTFNVSVVKKLSLQQSRREEYKFIDKYRTASLSLTIKT